MSFFCHSFEDKRQKGKKKPLTFVQSWHRTPSSGLFVAVFTAPTMVHDDTMY